MNNLRALIVSVDFADMLDISLERNRHHFIDVIVVTSTKDDSTVDIARAHGAEVYKTDSFYEPGAVFNKWKALEEGLDFMGRYGWVCLLDVDIIWPEVIPHISLEIGNLYGPKHRLIMKDPTKTIPDDWSRFPPYLPNCPLFGGYTQIFHATDPILGSPPWHEQNWRHAGGGDSYFQNKWPQRKKVRLPFDVLHLGEHGVNWCGRVTPHIADGVSPPEAEERMSQLMRFVKKPGFPRRGPHERY